jgi:hypothetical protein
MHGEYDVKILVIHFVHRVRLYVFCKFHARIVSTMLVVKTYHSYVIPHLSYVIVGTTWLLPVTSGITGSVGYLKFLSCVTWGSVKLIWLPHYMTINWSISILLKWFILREAGEWRHINRIISYPGTVILFWPFQSPVISAVHSVCATTFNAFCSNIALVLSYKSYNKQRLFPHISFSKFSFYWKDCVPCEVRNEC